MLYLEDGRLLVGAVALTTSAEETTAEPADVIPSTDLLDVVADKTADVRAVVPAVVEAEEPGDESAAVGVMEAESAPVEVLEAESAVLVDERGLALKKGTSWWGIKGRVRRIIFKTAVHPFSYYACMKWKFSYRTIISFL